MTNSSALPLSWILTFHFEGIWCLAILGST